MTLVRFSEKAYNFHRLQLLEERVGNKVLNRIIEKYIIASTFDDLEAFLNVNRHTLLSICKTNKLTECKCGQLISARSNRPMEKHQWDALFESNSQSQCGFSARKTLNSKEDMFDVSLSSLLILELKMFGTHLSDRERKIAVDAVQQIRKNRNFLHHKNNRKIENDEFLRLWRKFSGDICTLTTFISNGFQKKMQFKIDDILLNRVKEVKLTKVKSSVKAVVSVLIVMVLSVLTCSWFVTPLLRRTGDAFESKNCTLFTRKEVEEGMQIIPVFGEAPGLVSNHLVGEKRFKSGQAGPVASATYASATILGKQLLVVNMPSLSDTTSPNTASTEIAKCNELTSLGVDLILYVVEISRYSREESKALDDILDAYGHGVEEYVMVVFVGTERLLSHGLTLPQFVETFDDTSTLKKFFKKYKNHLVFPTTEIYATEPVRAILQEIETRGNQPLSIHWPVNKEKSNVCTENDDPNATGKSKRGRQADEILNFGRSVFS